MRALQFPFQVDGNGRLAMATTYSEVIRGQLIDALMTNWNERVMRPDYGSNMQGALFDPTEELVRIDAANQVLARVKNCAPRVNTRSIRFTVDNVEPNKLWVDVSYSAGNYEETRELRLPVAWFMSEETEI